MRYLRRPKLTPPTLQATGPGGQLAQQQRDDRAADPTVALSFPDHWNLADVRGALYAMHGKACGYCGRHLPGNDRGDVDHFRPKARVEGVPDHGGYWWLAYMFANYFLSCSVCNRTRKRDRFPLRRGARHYHFRDEHRLDREARALLDPAGDAIDEWVEVGWRERLCPIRPSAGLPSTARVQVAATIKFFRLNRDPHLVRARQLLVSKVNQALDDGRDNDARQKAIRFSAHSFVARAMLREVAPQLLPTPHDELDWLLRELLAELDVTLDLYEQYSQDSILKRQLDELFWSLAVLWSDPPAGTRHEIEKLLTTEKVVDRVRPFFALLR
jgi:hypothetical protein